MKYFWLSLTVILVGCGGKSGSPPPSSPSPTKITIQSRCTIQQPCNEFIIYRREGVCPVPLNNSSGWIFLGTTNNSMFIDLTVISGTTYSYDVEAINGKSFSGPSNCQTRSVL